MRQWVLKDKNKKDGTEAKEGNIKEILKKNAILQEENEILKKALSIFANTKQKINISIITAKGLRNVLK